MNLSRNGLAIVEESFVAPPVNKDFAFFYDGLHQCKLVVQKCSSCGTLRNPPGPLCRGCLSFDWKPFELTGQGAVYSFTVHHYPVLPFYQSPHGIVLAEMEEGIRIAASFDQEQIPQLAIGARVKTEFYRVNEDFTINYFSLA